MRKDRFNEMVDEYIAKCKGVLNAKDAEYSSDEDRLHNFKAAAAIQGISPRAALRGMLAKHTVSMYDMLRTDRQYTDAQWDEKLVDHINYVFLLKGILEDEKPLFAADTPILWRHDEAAKLVYRDICHAIKRGKITEGEHVCELGVFKGLCKDCDMWGDKFKECR